MPLARAETTFGAILYDPRRIELPTLADFDPARLEAGGRVRDRGRGRGEVLYLAARAPSDSADTWVLRHYRRGGLAAQLLEDRYFYRGEASTRAFAEARLLFELDGAGLPVPSPVAALYRRDGLYYRADLLTVAIPEVRTLASLIVEADSRPPEEGTLRAVGGAIRRLHDAGVWHADLNAHNLLVDRSGAAYVIDLDRGERRAPGPWRTGNLRRLRRSIDKVALAAAVVVPPSLWTAIVAGYEGV